MKNIWGINIAHASDAPATAADEIKLWTTHGGLVESADAEKEAEEYIKKYISGGADYTMALRTLVKDSIENRNTSDEVTMELTALLAKDAKGIKTDQISDLARAIFDFVVEEVEKSE